MRREELKSKLLEDTSRNYLLELSTGVGKTKLTLDKLNSVSPESILIVVPRKVLKDNWIEEVRKWGYNNLLPKITFTTYVSIHKHVGTWDYVIFDEAHHITKRVIDSISLIQAKGSIYLSATIPNAIKKVIKGFHGDLSHYTIDTSTAIENDILPEPKVILKELDLNDFSHIPCTFEMGKKTGIPKVVSFKEYKRFLGKYRITIQCTPQECLSLHNNAIEFWRSSYEQSGTEITKNKYLRSAKKRLEFLAKLKTDIIKKYLESKRSKSLVFCADIDQCNAIRPRSAVHSKNMKASDIITSFNEGTVKTITSCNMLNEGVSLKECEYGIFAYINASDIISVQKIGRILRHSSPKIVIFYFKDTREEVLVNKLLNKIK